MKPLVLITYRNRATHLSCLSLHLNKYFPELQLAVIEQDDNNVWNKGLLYNVGYKELVDQYDYIILHDVDWIPVVGKVDYSYCELPTMIGGAASQFNYKLFYHSFFGGVVVCSKEHYEQVNGFSNKFRGYGGEDDDFRRRFISKGIQTEIKTGVFECFHHPRPDNKPGSDFFYSKDYQHNLQILKQPVDYSDGLSSAEYTITDRIDYDNYINIKIKTNG